MFPTFVQFCCRLSGKFDRPVVGQVLKNSESLCWKTRHCEGWTCSAVYLHSSSKRSARIVTPENMNPNMKHMNYAVRGPLPIRAEEIEKELEKGVKKPFSEVINTNIGDCQAMGQKPLTFIRQVLTLCTYPQLMKDSHFPSDVKHRAETVLKACSGHSIGSYSNIGGIEMIKNQVAQYIEQRDGIPADPLNIILRNGATDGINNVLSMLSDSNSSKPVGVMMPVPQYPLYSAATAEYGMHGIQYYLDEDRDWALTIDELKRALDESKKICKPRALVVINPGNPTGSVLTRRNIEEIIKFAHEEKLFLLADEVYQHNVYLEGMKFYSFKKVMTEMGAPYKDMELASFMSTSKGYMGECGFRGGYCELVNIDPEVKRIFLKAIAAKLCPNVLGQATMYCVVNPPQKGEPSYELFVKEKENVLNSLKEKASLVVTSLNTIPGIKCNKVAGAMYAFPRLYLPERAIEKAKSLGQAPDFFYTMQLLENTGICVVPGSGFGQVPGTYHFRTTILPPTETFQAMLKRLEEYHFKFVEQYK